MKECHLIKYAIPLPDYKLKVIFRNGEVRLFDVKPFLNRKIFSRLKDEEYFRHVMVDEKSGSIFWQNGEDFCPDMVYEMSKPLDK